MNLASWIQRVGAALIDALPIVVVDLIGVLIANAAGSSAVAYIFYLVGIAFAVYNRWYLGGQGQSLGKRALGMHLIKEQTGQPIGMGLAFARDICHVVDSAICYIGYLFPLWDQKRQTLADKILGTLVTKD